MQDHLIFRFDVDGEDFTSAGQASVQVKKNLRQIGIDPDTIRKVSIAMYEGEINMVIHAGGGVAEVGVYDEYIEIILDDHGPGIADIEKAMQEGYDVRRLMRKYDYTEEDAIREVLAEMENDEEDEDDEDDE